MKRNEAPQRGVLSSLPLLALSTAREGRKKPSHSFGVAGSELPFGAPLVFGAPKGWKVGSEGEQRGGIKDENAKKGSQKGFLF